MRGGVLLDPTTGRPEGEDAQVSIVRNLGMIEELASLEAQGWKPRLAKMLLQDREYVAMDGAYYHDSRGPFRVAAETAVVLAATDKLTYPGFLTSLPANYFTPGKMNRLTVYGTITTVLTPGNIGVELYYGTTDAGGTLLASSAALALVASQTTIPFEIVAYVQCRVAGIAGVGSLFAWAEAKFGTAVIASPNDHFFIPASAPAAVAVDTTAASGFNVQIKRSGSTAESVTVQHVIFEALN